MSLLAQIRRVQPFCGLSLDPSRTPELTPGVEALVPE